MRDPLLLPPRPAASRSLLAALVLSLAGCASSPAVHFHSLMPVETPTRIAAAARAAPTSFVLDPVRIPAQVDQPQWLIRLPDDSVARLEQERWASPLRDELRGAILEWLVDSHGATETTSAAASAGAVRIGIDLRRFESIPSREVRLEGSWTLSRRGAGGSAGPSLSCELLVREPTAGPGYVALAAAQRRAVERLADQVGSRLGPFSVGDNIACAPKDVPTS